MDAETTTKPAVSFDVFAVSKEGYEVHFQLSGEKAYCHAVKLLDTMSKDGFAPRPTNGRNYGASKGARATAPAGEICQIHHMVMKQYSNERGSWLSHKLADGSYCNGKVN